MLVQYNLEVIRSCRTFRPSRCFHDRGTKRCLWRPAAEPVSIGYAYGVAQIPAERLRSAQGLRRHDKDSEFLADAAKTSMDDKRVELDKKVVADMFEAEVQDSGGGQEADVAAITDSRPELTGNSRVNGERCGWPRVISSSYFVKYRTSTSGRHKTPAIKGGGSDRRHWRARPLCEQTRNCYFFSGLHHLRCLLRGGGIDLVASATILWIFAPSIGSISSVPSRHRREILRPSSCP